MSRFQSYFDRRARSASLNAAIAITVCFTFTGCIGIFQLMKYLQNSDSFYLYAGPINILLGIFMVFHGVNLTHAVVRRLVAEARAALPLSAPAGN